MNDLEAYLKKTNTKASIVIKGDEEISDNWYWRDTTPNSMLDVWSITKKGGFAALPFHLLKTKVFRIVL